ncbi:hypothetical protein ACVP6W_003141 [Vibrio cholerae]
MNQRQFEKRLKALSKKHFGKCTCCKKAYTESCHTFSGLDYDGKVQDVGYCCKDNLEEIRAGGVYMAVDMNAPEAAQIQSKLALTHPLASHFSNPTGKTDYFTV